MRREEIQCNNCRKIGEFGIFVVYRWIYDKEMEILCMKCLRKKMKKNPKFDSIHRIVHYIAFSPNCDRGINEYITTMLEDKDK